MSGKAIKFGVEGRAAMLKGVETLADAVQVRFFKVSRYENSISNTGSYWIIREYRNF
jgi:hypoxanthine-guanine phosphoribosyltransferase